MEHFLGNALIQVLFRIFLCNQVLPPPPDITASPLGEQICPDNLVIWMDLIHLFEGTKALMANYL